MKKDVVEIPASRPLLVLNHNPKAGGTTIIRVLDKIKPRQVKCRIDCKEKHWERAVSVENGEDANTTWVHVAEFGRTDRKTRAKGFIIGTIREPCSQYVSLWTWGNRGGGLVYHNMKKKNKLHLYGNDPPFWNTTSDREIFKAWMRDGQINGHVGKALRNRCYGDNLLDAVDCWVFVEDFEEGLMKCLRRFERQGGVVDWSKFVRKEDGAVDWLIMGSKPEGRRSLWDGRSVHHGKCSSMFDEETAKMVEGNEKFVYELFNYGGCCDAGENFRPRMELIGETVKFVGEAAELVGGAAEFPPGRPLEPRASVDKSAAAYVTVGAVLAGIPLLAIIWVLRKQLTAALKGTKPQKKEHVEFNRLPPDEDDAGLADEKKVMRIKRRRPLYRLPCFQNANGDHAGPAQPSQQILAE